MEDAETKLFATVERIRRMEKELAARERRLAAAEQQQETDMVLPWRSRAVQLAAEGLSAREIARQLEVPAGEVELVLTFARREP